MYVFIDCIFWTDHISLYKLDLSLLCIIITNHYHLYLIIETHFVLCLLLPDNKFYIHSSGSLEYKINDDDEVVNVWDMTQLPGHLFLKGLKWHKGQVSYAVTPESASMDLYWSSNVFKEGRHKWYTLGTFKQTHTWGLPAEISWTKSAQGLRRVPCWVNNCSLNLMKLSQVYEDQIF